MTADINRRLIALGYPALALVIAYVGQYGFGLYPCEMCWWQRYALFAALVPATAAFLVPRSLRAMMLWVAVAIIAVNALIAGYHAGVEYGWWNGVTACAAPPVSGGDMMTQILNAPLVRCDVVQWQLAGISMAGWNCLLSTGAIVTIFALGRRRRR